MDTESCCSEAKDQQLYMLELLVDRLNLTAEKILEIGSKPLTVRLEFLDFPAFEINEEEFWSTKKRNEKQTTLLNERKSVNGSLDFGAGKSCLFPKRPNELVDAMLSKPLKVGIYESAPRKICSKEETDVAVCKSEVPLSGCLCDQLTMSMNDAAHLPKPYTLRNTWNLIDDAGKPSGTILLFLRLACLGKSIVAKFAIKNQSLLFKNSNSFDEFQCGKVSAYEENDENYRSDENGSDRRVQIEEREKQVNSWPKPRSIIGLVSICQELAKRDGGPLEIVPSAKLSTRRMVREKFPSRRDITRKACINERVRVCRPNGGLSSKAIEKFPRERKNCSGGLCIGPRMMESFGRTQRDKNGHCCSGDSPNYSYGSRLRGGGPWNDLTSGSRVVSQTPNIYRQKYRDEEANRFPGHTMENLISGACESRVARDSSKKPGCGCFGKFGTGATGLSDTRKIDKNYGCSNEPCQGIDCLIRAFRETENFVNSIGKIPGLAGLGLMDPAESPYFGRDRDDAPTSCDPKFQKSTSPMKFPTGTHHHHHQSRQPSGKLDAKKIGTNVASTGHISALNRDDNVHQSDVTFVNLTKTKKKPEERIDKQRELQETTPISQTFDGETSPCGETMCKSSRKKKKETSDENINEEKSLSPTNIQESTRIIAIPKKSLKSRRKRKQQRGRMKTLTIQGSAGDGANNYRNSHIRVSKRIMRLVSKYVNTRFCHGHKNCVDVRLRVPGNMGWLWNIGESPGRLKTPIGWKPGAISKVIWERLQQAKQIMTLETTSSSSDMRASTPTSKGKRNRALKSKSFNALGRGQWAKNRMQDQDDDEIELPPTLHIHRKDGTYYVTMYPVKIEDNIDDETKMRENLKPLQFKVTKNRDNSEEAESSSAGSDIEIEFSPPAAINRYRKKEPVKHQDTQVNQQEILDTLKVTSVKRQSKTKKAKNNK